MDTDTIRAAWRDGFLCGLQDSARAGRYTGGEHGIGTPGRRAWQNGWDKGVIRFERFLSEANQYADDFTESENVMKLIARPASPRGQGAESPAQTRGVKKAGREAIPAQLWADYYMFEIQRDRDIACATHPRPSRESRGHGDTSAEEDRMDTITTEFVTAGQGWAEGPVPSGIACLDGCGGEMVGTGAIATGETLPNGYTPAEGELLSFNYISCSRCGTWQVS